MNIFIVRGAVLGPQRRTSAHFGTLDRSANNLCLNQRTNEYIRQVHWSYKCSEHLGWVVSVSTRWFTYGSCHVISHFRSSDRVKEVSPIPDTQRWSFPLYSQMSGYRTNNNRSFCYCIKLCHNCKIILHF